MNKVEQKLIKWIDDIDYEYVEKNMTKNERPGYAYERMIAERLVERGLEDIREMVYHVGEYTRGSKKGQPKYDAWKCPAPITHEVRVKGDVQAVSEIMPNNSFKLSPFGDRSPVDILIKIDGVVIALECKSVKSENGVPEWNDNMPKPEFLYAFIRSGQGNPVFKLGAEIISKQDREDELNVALLYQALHNSQTEREFVELSEEIKKIKFNKGEKRDIGFNLFLRKKFDQTRDHFEGIMNAV